MKLTRAALVLPLLFSPNNRDNRVPPTIEENVVPPMRRPSGSTPKLKQLKPVSDQVTQFTEILKQGGSTLLWLIDHAIPSIPMVGADAANLEKKSYTKGDGMDNIVDFSKAVSEEFTVYSNKKALGQFTRKVIMVYGQDHSNVMIPGFRGPKGALLLEATSLDQCLKKHKGPGAPKGNICKSIDLLDQGALIKSYGDLYQSLRKLIAQLDSNEDKRIGQKAKVPGMSAPALINEMVNFVHHNYDSLIKGKTKNVQESLEILKYQYETKLATNNRLVTASLKGRNAGMVDEASRIIKTLDDDSTAVLIVGAAHAEEIYRDLSKLFPDHAVVLCFPNEWLDLLVNKGMKSVLESASQTRSSTRSEL